MTSIVLPSLKRSITDIMDDELYHLPNSPIQVNNHSLFGNNNNNSNMANTSATATGAAATASKFAASTSSSPSLTHSQLYTHSNNSNGTFATFLNLPNEVSEKPTSTYSLFESNHYMEAEPSAQRSSPFTDYGNPESSLNPNAFITPNQVYPTQYPYSSQFPTYNAFNHNKPNRRRRITTLDEDQDPNSKKKEEDYLLYNTDIQPSTLINNDLDDYSLFVPATQLENNDAAFRNDIIPGYENDYLLADAFEEDVEEDLSEDEDEDNYFHIVEDDEFDELLSNTRANSDPIDADDFNFMEMDEYLKPSELYNDNNKLDKNDVMNGGFLDVKREKIEEVPSYPEPVEDYDDDNMDMDEDDEEHLAHHQTAAEITAQNPNHQCDLINPSTGVPCNKQFSRPYDLIRHQETIHASKKKIFRCVICEGRYKGGHGNGKQKTFSRGDALSRHIKVKHGLVGKEALDIINEAKDNVEYVSV